MAATTESRPDVEVSETIAAPPRAVYNLVTDVPRMGEWSPETASCRWLDGATGARPGSSCAAPRPVTAAVTIATRAIRRYMAASGSR